MMVADRPRTAKGERPFFLADPDCERLLTMLMALAGEISLLNDKLDTVIRVAAISPRFGLDDIAAYVPDDGVRAERAQRREAMLGRVLRIVEADAERAISPPLPYDTVVKMVSEPESPTS